MRSIAFGASVGVFVRCSAFLGASRACVVLLPCCFPSRCAVRALNFACVAFSGVRVCSR